MDNTKRYDLFIFISTLARNILLVFSSVLLYKMGYSVKHILLFYSILHFVGAIVSVVTIYLIDKIKINYLLIISSIIFSISFYYMSVMNKDILHLIIFSIIYSIGSYSYHCIRHYLAINSLSYSKRKGIGNIIIYMNIAVIISSLLSGYIESISSIVVLSIIVIIISIIGIIPIFKFDIKNNDNIIKFNKLSRNKLLFFILEQGKTVFLSLEPLYIFLFVEESIKYVGITSSLIGLSSCIFIYFFVRKIDDKKYFKYFNILLCFILILKLNIYNKYMILLVVFIEGLLIKMYDVISTENLYDIDKNISIRGYLIESEIVFCLVRSILYFIFVFISNIKMVLYILITFIFISGFVKRK